MKMTITFSVRFEAVAKMASTATNAQRVHGWPAKRWYATTLNVSIEKMASTEEVCNNAEPNEQHWVKALLQKARVWLNEVHECFGNKTNTALKPLRFLAFPKEHQIRYSAYGFHHFVQFTSNSIQGVEHCRTNLKRSP
jgi:hypothetical protein